MKQALLFTRQPAKTLKAFIQEQLRDLDSRQAKREARRQRQNEQARIRKQRPTDRKEFPNVRVIRVTYRAVFEQPIGILNPMGVKLTASCPVEVFGNGARWQVRELEHGHLYERLGRFPSATAAQTSVAESFARQVQPWQMWAVLPGTNAERLIEPDEVQVLSDGRVAFRLPEDYTHILHAPTIDPKSKVPPAACGAKVPAAAFINNRANIEPTCKECAKVWREHYQEQSA